MERPSSPRTSTFGFILEDEENVTVLRWALSNTFDVSDLVDFALRAASRLRRWPSRPALRALLPLTVALSRLPDRRIRRAARFLAIEMGEVQERGRRYWRPIVSELKRLQKSGRLIPEGTTIASLLG